jgi:hypothetical protein
MSLQHAGVGLRRGLDGQKALLDALEEPTAGGRTYESRKLD